MTDLTMTQQDAMQKAERGCTACLDSHIGRIILDVARCFPEYVIVRVDPPVPPLYDDIDSCFDAEDYSTISAILTEAGCQALAFSQNRLRP